MIELIQCVNDGTGVVWSRQCADTVHRFIGIMVVVASVGIVAIIAAAHVVFSNRKLRMRLVAASTTTNELQTQTLQQQIHIGDLQGYAHNLKQLNDLSDILQVCDSNKELLNVVSGFARRFFAADTGAIYLMGNANAMVGEAESWGDITKLSPAFTCEECWAMRQGRIHPQRLGQHNLQCRHLHRSDSEHYSLCVPLNAHGKNMGVICLLRDQPFSEKDTTNHCAFWPLVESFAEHVALAFYNLELREHLLNQSVKDPLTGLYNRRFLHSQLELEMARSTRSGRPFSVLTIDIDLFKRINDQFGHDAGDHVLQKVSEVFGQCVRKSDVACRYGGEEFMVFMPGIDICQARYRGEQVRMAIENNPITFRGIDIGVVTVSIGLASYPQHGSDARSILQQADVALYRSKRNGRNRLSLPSEPGVVDQDI